MKKIQELGISPAPWTNEQGEVVASDGQTLFEAMLDNDDANARLIAAAPELYEALAAMLHCAEKEAPYTDMSHMDIAMDMARKALSKAAKEGAKDGDD